jgi:hypothetical protein
MIEEIEVKDGHNWVACTAREPKSGRTFQSCLVYHPSAKIDYSSSDGSDDHYTCPHCNAS